MACQVSVLQKQALLKRWSEIEVAWLVSKMAVFILNEANHPCGYQTKFNEDIVGISVSSLNILLIFLKNISKFWSLPKEN